MNSCQLSQGGIGPQESKKPTARPTQLTASQKENRAFRIEQQKQSAKAGRLKHRNAASLYPTDFHDKLSANPFL